MSSDRAALRRRPLLEMALRRAQPGSGSMIAFLRTRTWKDPVVSLDLRSLRTPFVIVGGVATALYMPQRLTDDLDILVLATDAPLLHQELIAAGCSRIGNLTVGGTSWAVPGGGTLDVLESSEPWAATAVGEPNRSPTGLPVIALPYLVLLKLGASRSLDLGDLTRMLGLADEPTRQQVREAVALYRPEDLPDLESLIALGDLELEVKERTQDDPR